MHNLLVAQSGGPTSAINATLSGVITEAMIQGLSLIHISKRQPWNHPSGRYWWRTAASSAR